jgi:type IV pilus assembly protein PilV
MSRTASTRATASEGFTLVEVLVALVVLAIGSLGVADMLLTGLRESRNALERTEAVLLAADLADRIRANRPAGGMYQLEEGAVLGPPAVDCRIAGACEPADLARLDLYEWQQSALATLPAARTSVRVIDVSGVEQRRYEITVGWESGGTDGPGRFELTVLA